MDLKKKLSECRLYGFTPDKYLNGRNLLEIVEMQLSSGVDIIQLREKKMSDREKFKLAIEIKKISEKYNKIFIVNDDITIAQLSDADGVHLGQDDIEVKYCRKILGEKKIIGLSTHNENQYSEGQLSCADYTAIGPVFQTFTKDNPAPVVTLNKLPEILKTKKKFTVAIGGINQGNIDCLSKFSIDCFAVVSDIVCCDDIKSSVKRLKKIIDRIKEKNKSLNIKLR
ncbi:thiamine phosphate synthase [Candidatus Dependentiae bacterium]|nr:thiamine phosphate synthase [Candidatus Dependentiae bacterium]